MASVRARVHAGVIVVLLLFVGVTVSQLVIGDRLQVRHANRLARAELARDTNTAILQFMTDAETGVTIMRMVLCHLCPHAGPKETY